MLYGPLLSTGLETSMKIAFLNIVQGSLARGAETFVKELSQRLSQNHEIIVFEGRTSLPPRWPVFWRTYLDPQGLKVLFFTLSKVPQLLKTRPDVAIPLNGGWQAMILRLVTRVYGGKLVISGQSGKGWDDRVNLLAFPDSFIALSTRLKNWASGFNPFIKVVYIPNGVDILKFKPGGEALQTNLKKPVVLVVGALTDEKRIELAVRAVAQLDASLLVVGDGPLKNRITTLAKNLLGKRFQIMKANFEDMSKVYRAADIFTLPSPWYRSFEIVLTEAMATNVPVVANDDPIRREIVGDAGFFVDPTDKEAYAQAIEKALKTSWGDKPRKQSEKFSWDIIAKKYEDLFTALLK